MEFLSCKVNEHLIGRRMLKMHRGFFKVKTNLTDGLIFGEYYKHHNYDPARLPTKPD
jgi:hypothetical protein